MREAQYQPRVVHTTKVNRKAKVLLFSSQSNSWNQAFLQPQELPALRSALTTSFQLIFKTVLML